MLAKTRRLRKARDINRVYARGKFGGGEQLQIKALKTHGPQTRAAIVVSRKVAKKAVTRNRIKRRLSAQLAELWETVLPGYDIVVIVRADIAATSVENLRSLLETALRRSGSFKPPHEVRIKQKES